MTTLSAFALVGVHCSSDTTGNPTPGTDGGGTDGGPGTDTGPGTDSGGKDSTAGTKAYVGSVNFSESKSAATLTQIVSAGFVPTPTGSGGGCAGTMSGMCCYTPPPMAGVDAGAPPTPVGAGTITVKDGATTTATLTFAAGAYTGGATPMAWMDGDTLDVSAPGDTVHAFMGTVKAAALLAGVMPALSYAMPTTVDTTKDFTMTWTKDTGNVSLMLIGLKGANSEGTIVCTGADTGTMTATKDLLAKFTVGDTGIISLSRTIASDVSNDNATISLNSSVSAGGSAKF